MAKFEFEWAQAFREKVNEVEKLSEAAAKDEAETYVFIGYSDKRMLDRNLAAIETKWKHHDRHLIVFLIIYDLTQKRRYFREFTTFAIKAGKHDKIRSQEALPWDVPKTRWSAGIDRSKIEG